MSVNIKKGAYFRSNSCRFETFKSMHQLIKWTLQGFTTCSEGRQLIGNNARVRESQPTCPRADERDELSCRDLEALAYLNDTISLSKVQVEPFNQSESFIKVPS